MTLTSAEVTRGSPTVSTTVAVGITSMPAAWADRAAGVSVDRASATVATSIPAAASSGSMAYTLSLVVATTTRVPARTAYRFR
jgi:hypothetical protein